MKTFAAALVLVSLALVSLLALSGCGSDDFLGGKVTFEDGTPLTQGTVCFVRDGFIARSAIQSDGTYLIGSRKSGGLPPGIYRIYIAGATSLIDPKMASPETSGLTCKMPLEDGALNITVEHPK